MDDDYRIRDAKEADVAAIESIERASFPDPWSKESFQTLLAYPSFVAVDSEGGIAGYLFAVGVEDAGEILNVAVSAEHRRRGLGRRLVEHALEVLQGRGVFQIFLEVRESNSAARALYEALGFEVIGRRRGYYRKPIEDALVLRWGGGRREEGKLKGEG